MSSVLIDVGFMLNGHCSLSAASTTGTLSTFLLHNPRQKDVRLVGMLIMILGWRQRCDRDYL